MIIFDLDHTLFNTDILKKDFKRVFLSHGFSEKDFLETFKKAYDIEPKTKGCYSIDKHLSILSQFDRKQKELIKDQLLKIMARRGTGYLYRDTIPLLKKLRTAGVSMVLVTKGNSTFQKLKLSVAKLDSYFREIHIIPDDKVHIIKKFYKNKTININDRKDELQQSKKAFPNLVCILVERNNKKNKQQRMGGVITVSNLGQVFRYT